MAPKIRHCACRIIPLRSSWPLLLPRSVLLPLIVRSSRSSPQAKEREEGGRAGKAVRRLG